MSPRRPLTTLLLVVPLTMALSPALASGDAAYDKVASAYAQSGGQLDPCAFTQAELQAGIRGIPPEIRDVVPALRRAMRDGVAAHERGECRGRRPDEGTTGGAAPGAATPGAIPPVTTPTPTAPATTVPPATDSAPLPSTTPAPAPAATPAQPATTVSPERDRTPLLIALVILGALLLLAILLWAIARSRGWDPYWVARTRHAWGEAGFRTTSTWAEFTDWLRLGR